MTSEGDLKHMFEPVFRGVGKLQGCQVKLTIDPEVQPVAQPVGAPFGLRSKVKAKIQELIEQDIIEPVAGRHFR